MAIANTTSIRQRIIEGIAAKFSGMQADAPASDPYGIAWTTVAIGPLASFDQRKRYSLGVVVGTETEKFLYPYTEYFMYVNVEFRITHNRDDPDPGIMAEQALTVIRRAMTEDRTWGGLAVDTKGSGAEVDLITYADRAVVGVGIFQVQYRTSYDDVRSQVPQG